MSDDPATPPVPGRTLREALPSLLNAFSTRLLSIGLMVAAFALVASAPAAAHGRLGAAEGRCRLFIGPDVMNFTGYLPDASKVEFCEDIPATGHVIVALDDVEEELRDMKVEVRIVRDVGGAAREEENLDAVTVAYVGAALLSDRHDQFRAHIRRAGLFRRHRHGDRRAWRTLGVALPLLGREELCADAADLSAARRCSRGDVLHLHAASERMGASKGSCATDARTATGPGRIGLRHFVSPESAWARRAIVLA